MGRKLAIIDDLEYYIYKKIDEFYLSEELNYFWWPSENESKEFWNKYKSLPQNKREELLKSVPWDFETVFNEIGQGEYFVKECNLINDNTGRLYFDPIGWPYGGNQVLQEVIKSFGAIVIKVHE